MAGAIKFYYQLDLTAQNVKRLIPSFHPKYYAATAAAFSGSATAYVNAPCIFCPL